MSIIFYTRMFGFQKYLGIFPENLKQQRLHQFLKRVPNLNVPIIDKFHYYLMQTKSLKNVGTKE